MQIDTIGDELTKESYFRETCEMWFAEVQLAADYGDRAKNTARLYRGWLDNHVIPALGNLRNRQVLGTRCDKLIKHINTTISYSSAKSVRSVLSGACNYAVRFGAMDINPVASVQALLGGEDKEIIALDFEQRTELLAGLDAYAATKIKDSKGRRVGKRVLVWSDLRELQEAMLATGVRIGEVLALAGENFYRDPQQRPMVRIEAHIVRVKGVGLVREPYRKGSKRILELQIPEWSVSLFRRRSLAAGPQGPMFRSAIGHWLDPSNTITRLKDAYESCGYGWISSHVMRKTVTEVLIAAGLSISAVSDQLGDSPRVVERYYRKPRTNDAATVAALEDMMRPKKAT